MAYYDAGQFWQGVLNSQFDLTGVGHGGYGLRYNRFLYKAKQRAFFRALRCHDISIASQSVLDVGCGVGFFTEISKSLGCQSYTGVDITAASVKRLAGRYPEYDFHQVDISTELAPAIASAQFDVVYFFDVIYHIVDPQRFVNAANNIWSLVKPGGYLLMIDSYWNRDLIPGGTLEDGTGPQHPHVCFHSLSDSQDVLFSRPDFSLLGFTPMYYLFNRPIVGDRFPWTNERISWNLRHRVCEQAPVLWLMYALDGLLTKLITHNPSLKLMAAQKSLAKGGT